MAHIADKQVSNPIILTITRAISPGLTMSVLGFISAYLLVTKRLDGAFYLRRFTRIYSSLIFCLSVIALLHLGMGYKVATQHSLIHALGLSAFLPLLQVANKSSLGSGLWFITVIVLMYLILPLIRMAYEHQHGKIHLIAVVVGCLIIDNVMYGVGSVFNVVIAFNIGCYVGLHSDIETFTKHPWPYYLAGTIGLCGLVGWGIVDRGLLFPFYPLFAVPLLYKVRVPATYFSSISFEVYILHFYFINRYFSDMFGSMPIYLQIAIALMIVLPLAHVLSKLSAFISRSACAYFLRDPGEKLSFIPLG
jgi:peptidoglycan/LPS O-acetylase OafA/YrhL